MKAALLWVDLFNNWIILVLIAGMILFAWFRGVKVYEEFVKGAKEGFDVAVLIIPYLVVILCAVGAFDSGGAMQILTRLLKPFTDFMHMDPQLVPLALIRPLSGSGARGLMFEIWNNSGVDSIVGLTASVMQGSTETTFYVLAVYLGSVGVRRTRGVLAPLLLGDLAGFITAILISNWYFRTVLGL
jgi:spore maturation protein B